MQKDYIMRIVEQLVQAILAIMRRRKNGEYKEAREQARTAVRYLLRMDIDLLLLFDNEHVLNRFKDFANRLDTERCVLGADLLQELALIEEAEQQTAIAKRLKVLCLYLYMTALPKEHQFQKPEYLEKVADLIKELKDQPLSEEVRVSVRPYEEFVATEQKSTNSDAAFVPKNAYFRTRLFNANFNLTSQQKEVMHKRISTKC